MVTTLEGLCQAYLGESQARNRYTFYAKVASDEGYEQIAEIFRQTADQEKEHAKQLFLLFTELKNKIATNDKLVMKEVEVPFSYATTKENLEAAAAGEHHEFTMMYPEFAKVAEKEGYKDIANKMKAIA